MWCSNGHVPCGRGPGEGMVVLCGHSIYTGWRWLAGCMGKVRLIYVADCEGGNRLTLNVVVLVVFFFLGFFFVVPLPIEGAVFILDD